MGDENCFGIWVGPGGLPAGLFHASVGLGTPLDGRSRAWDGKLVLVPGKGCVFSSTGISLRPVG